MEMEIIKTTKRDIKKGKVRKHLITLLVKNEFGVLARITTLIAGKGYSIESLSVGKTNETDLSRITLEVVGDDIVIDQVIKQLRRLIDTVKVRDITDVPKVERELILVKVHAPASKERDEILRLVQIFRAKIVDTSPDTFTIELTGDSEKTDAFLELIRSFGIKEMAATGKIALRREREIEDIQD